MQALLLKAIKTRKVIQFAYYGEERIVEPFKCGEISGVGFLEGYLIGGYSESENKERWRLYQLDKIKKLKITDKKAASSRPGYNPNDKRFLAIFCKVK